MLRKLSCVAVLCLLAMVVPALAQETDSQGEAAANEAAASEEGRVRHGWGLRVSWLEGGAVSKTAGSAEPPIVGLTEPPTLKDSFTVGALYYYELTPRLTAEFRVALGQSDVEHVCPGAEYDPEVGIVPQNCADAETEVSTNVGYIEFVALPHWKLGRIDLGVPIGFGWGWLRSSDVFAPSPFANQQNVGVQLESGSGMTYFVGLRPSWNVGKRSMFAEVRALRFHRLVTVNSRTLKSVEVSLGMKFPFGG